MTRKLRHLTRNLRHLTRDLNADQKQEPVIIVTDRDTFKEIAGGNKQIMTFSATLVARGVILQETVGQKIIKCTT